MSPRYALDTCVILAEIREEDGRVGLLAGALEEAGKGECRLLVSTLVFSEILDAKVPRFLNASYVDVMGVDVPVSMVARSLRQKFELKVPDAIHLATALVSAADWLLTYDNDLLKLDGERVEAQGELFPGSMIRTASPDRFFTPMLL